MNSHGKRARLGGVLLAVALAAAAILALPAIGLSKNGSDKGAGPPPAGTIESFDTETGELVVDLADGDTISALVVRRTKIRCGKGRRHRGRHGAAASRRGESEPGDDRGRHSEEEPGGDQGGRGPESGDDGVESGDHHGRGHHGERCNTGDLVEGAVVMRAEIVLTHGKALYKKIGLLPPQVTTTEAPSGE